MYFVKFLPGLRLQLRDLPLRLGGREEPLQDQRQDRQPMVSMLYTI
jgi:hypothetical protein